MSASPERPWTPPTYEEALDALLGLWSHCAVDLLSQEGYDALARARDVLYLAGRLPGAAQRDEKHGHPKTVMDALKDEVRRARERGAAQREGGERG